MHSPPLRQPNFWIHKNSHTVQVRLKEGIHGHSVQNGKSVNDMSLESRILSQLTTLEFLLQREQMSSSEIGSQKIDKLLLQIKETARKLHPTKDISQILEKSNIILGVLVPNVAAKLGYPIKTSKGGGSAEEFLNYIGVLNQLSVMSHQLKYDTETLTNHKYIAHQIALLYQCLNQVGDAGVAFKKRIEQKFEQVKSSTESQKLPLLTKEQQDWLLGVTLDITREVSVWIKKATPISNYMIELNSMKIH